MRIVETFTVTGRGLVAIVDGHANCPVGKALRATITRADGTSISAEASKEYVLRRVPTTVEFEAFVLGELTAPDVPVGSEIAVEDSGE